jgi:hypothetical protein
MCDPAKLAIATAGINAMQINLHLNQCFHNRSFKNPFRISKIPFSPQNFLEKIKKIQAI